MRRLERALHGLEQVGADRVELDRVAQPRGERGDGRLGVVAGAVEAAVDEPLDAQAQRVEERRRRERRGRDADRPESARVSVVSAIRPMKTPASSAVRIA